MLGSVNVNSPEP